MADSEEITKQIDLVYKNLLDKFNPAARHLISAGKAYLKALHAAMASSKTYLEALSRLARQSQQSSWGGSADVGSCLGQMVDVYNEVQSQQMNILKAFYVDLLVPLENNLDRDTKVLQADQKKFLATHKQRFDSYAKASAVVKKHKKKNKASKQNMDKEIKHFQNLDEEKAKLDNFLSISLQEASKQERRRYGFILERQSSLAKHYLAYHSKGASLLQNHIQTWVCVAKTREDLPAPTVDIMPQGNNTSHNYHHEQDAHHRRARSVEGSCNDLSMPDTPDCQGLTRARSDFHLDQCTQNHHSRTCSPSPSIMKRRSILLPDDSGRRLLARALYMYQPSAENQLGFLESDVIALIGDKNKGWQYGENLRTQRLGWFPVAYTETIQDEDDSALGNSNSPSRGRSESFKSSVNSRASRAKSADGRITRSPDRKIGTSRWATSTTSNATSDLTKALQSATTSPTTTPSRSIDVKDNSNPQTRDPISINPTQRPLMQRISNYRSPSTNRSNCRDKDCSPSSHRPSNASNSRSNIENSVSNGTSKFSSRKSREIFRSSNNLRVADEIQGSKDSFRTQRSGILINSNSFSSGMTSNDTCDCATSMSNSMSSTTISCIHCSPESDHRPRFRLIQDASSHSSDSGYSQEEIQLKERILHRKFQSFQNFKNYSADDPDCWTESIHISGSNIKKCSDRDELQYPVTSNTSQFSPLVAPQFDSTLIELNPSPKKKNIPISPCAQKIAAQREKNKNKRNGKKSLKRSSSLLCLDISSCRGVPKELLMADYEDVWSGEWEHTSLIDIKVDIPDPPAFDPPNPPIPSDYSSRPPMPLPHELDNYVKEYRHNIHFSSSSGNSSLEDGSSSEDDAYMSVKEPLQEEPPQPIKKSISRKNLTRSLTWASPDKKIRDKKISQIEKHNKVSNEPPPIPAKHKNSNESPPLPPRKPHYIFSNETLMTDVNIFNYSEFMNRRLKLPEGNSRLDQRSHTSGNVCGPWYDLWGDDQIADIV